MKVAFYLLALVLTASVARAAKFSVDLAAAHSEKACRTAKYRDDTGKPVSNMLLVRQGCKFDVVVELDAPASTAPVITATRTGGGATTGWKSAPAAGAAPGGKVWKLTVTAGSAAGGDTVVGEHSLVATAGAEKVPLALKAWLLFNPFDKTSPFFVTNDARRADMTENEQGAIWVGSSSKPTWSPWAYNHFSANVWDVVFKTTSKISSSDLANHVTAVRAFAKQIASVILEGKWGSTGYEDSDKKPWEWASSEDIYAVVRQKNRKAKYGQCMIYSAVTASYLRAMGVPAASNTGYDFVQDSGGDRLIKVAYKLDASGQYQWSEADNNKFGDKVWNFHAWTIVDMARPDLGIAEVKPNIADGTWHAGPVSLDKFKAGDMKANYDTSSYDTCINSDVQYVFLDQTGKVQSTWEKPFIPANSIVTKKDDSPVGCKNTYDASTGRYNGLCLVETVGDYKKTIPKPNARPASMRFRSLRSRVAGGPGADTDADDDDKEHHVAEQEHDADEGYVISTSMPLSRRLGNKFHAAMKLNKPAEELQVTVWATTYDGRPIYVLMEGKVKNEKQYRINVPTEAWFRGKNGAHDVAEQAKTAAATHIKAVFTALNKGKVVAADVRVMPISMPKVNILCGKKTVHVGDKITCSISFSNPMPYKIKATLDIDLAGNTKLPGDFEPQTIEIGEKVNRADASSYLGRWVSVHLPTPTTPGKTLLIVSVRVPTLNEIKGVSEFEVLERPATELEKVQLRKVAPAGQGRAPQTPIAPPQAPNAKLPPPK